MNIKLYKICSIIISLLLHFSIMGQGYPAASVNVVAAEIKNLAPVAWVSGTVISRNRSEISAEVSGRLTALIDLGRIVSKGDVIAEIDNKTLLISKKEYVATVASTKSRLKFLESEVQRKTTLAKRNLASATDVDQATSERDAAKANLTIANARLALVQQDLAYSMVKAPFDGMVTQRLRNLGEYVNDGNAIIQLVETENLEASVFAPITAYQFLKKAQTIAVESPLGNGMATIKSLIPVADSRSHLMQVRLDMSSFHWPIGLNIKVAVANGENKEVLAVPRDALVLRRENISVFRINSENIAEQIQVKVGIGAGGFVEIIGDIKPGDQVVIRGAERLEAGQTVQIKQNNESLVSGQQ